MPTKAVTILGRVIANRKAIQPPIEEPTNICFPIDKLSNTVKLESEKLRLVTDAEKKRS